MPEKHAAVATKEQPVIFEPRWLQAPILLRALQMATIAALAFQPVTARAERSLWGSVGHWSVYTDVNNILGCYVERIYADATVLTLALYPKPPRQDFHFTLANRNWKFLKGLKAHALRLQFDQESAIELGARTVMADGGLQVLALSDNVKLLDKFGRHETVRINLSGANIATLKLDRAADALSEMRDCKTMMRQDNKRSSEVRSDPFARTPAAETLDDPFAKPQSETTPDDPFAKPPASSASDDPFAKKP